MPISFESGLSILPNSNGNDSQPNLRQYTQFCHEHENDIYTYVLRMIGNREDAEDLTQEALLQAYRTWNQVDPELPGGYVKWCYRIAHNLSIDLLRKKKPRYADDEEMERAADEKSPRPEEVYENRARSDQVREAIGELEEKYREVLILRYQEDISYEKIAEILEVPVSTIETRIFRAKAMLRQKLEKRK